MTRRQRRKIALVGRHRRGIVTLEVVLALPVLLVLLLGLVEISLLLFGRSDVLEASRAGARLATLSGVDEEDVRDEVQRTLRGRYGAEFDVETLLGEFSGDEVVVTVRVPMSSAAPDLLWPIGYSLRGQQYVAETRMLKE